jgi:hypothetical protein
MSSTQQKDQATKLAKQNPRKALERARNISNPWYKAQALSWVTRYTDGDPLSVAREAEQAASSCNDDYKRTAVRAWEVAALAERGLVDEARKILMSVLSQQKSVTPLSSRSEALILLLHASFRIGMSEAKLVVTELKSACGNDSHWRCKRAIKDANKLLTEEMKPRPFYW